MDLFASTNKATGSANSDQASVGTSNDLLARIWQIVHAARTGSQTQKRGKAVEEITEVEVDLRGSKENAVEGESGKKQAAKKIDLCVEDVEQLTIAEVTAVELSSAPSAKQGNISTKSRPNVAESTPLFCNKSS